MLQEGQVDSHGMAREMSLRVRKIDGPAPWVHDDIVWRVEALAEIVCEDTLGRVRRRNIDELERASHGPPALTDEQDLVRAVVGPAIGHLHELVVGRDLQCTANSVSNGATFESRRWLRVRVRTRSATHVCYHILPF